MKIFQVLTVFLFSLHISSAYSQEWVRTYTSNQGSGYHTWGGGIETYDKGFAIIGNNGIHKYGLIIKSDINGFELWNKFYGSGSYHFVPNSIEQTLDFGYIIVGTMSKYGTKDAFILKLNSCFEKEWCKVLHTNNYFDDYGQDVKQLPDGGYVLLTRYYDGIDPGHRIHLHKLDQEGELIWQHNYADNDTLLFGEEGLNLLIINENEYLITGYGYYPDSGQYMGWIRPLLIKVDSLGNEYWKTIWGSNDHFYGQPLYNSIVDNSGSIYNTGFRVAENALYPVLLKTNDDGQEEYHYDVIDTCYEGYGITATWTEDSLIYTQLGWQNWDESFNWGFFTIDTLGTTVDHKDISTPLVSIISSIKTFDNKFLSVGILNDETYGWVIYAYKLNADLEYDTLYSAPFIYDSLCPYEIISDTTDIDCDILVLINDQFVPLEQAQLKIYPNPAKDKVTFRYPDVTGIALREIIVYNNFGNEVKRIRLMRGDEETNTDVSGLPSGIYFIKMIEKGKCVASGKMMIVK